MKQALLPLIGVIGPGRSGPELEAMAYQAGQLIAERGFGLVCGGLEGVMASACKGAFQAGGLTVGILPGSSAGEANSYVRIAIPTGMGEGRNLIVVRASIAVLALGGGLGTLSEIALALKLGVPVFGVKTWIPVDAEGTPAPIMRFDRVGDAVQAIEEHRNAWANQGGED